MILNYKKLDPAAIVPKKKNLTDAGYDLHALIPYTIQGLFSHEDDYDEGKGFSKRYTFDWGIVKPQTIKTGIAIEIPDGYFGLICDRSGLGSKGIKVHGGVIDSSYRGELIVCLHNISNENFHINPGDRIAQLLILPVANPIFKEVTELSETKRGDTGFGSSGLKEFHE